MPVSPIGMSVEEDSRRDARQDLKYRAERDRLAPFEAVARFVIIRRAELGLTQKQLAERVGTSHSAISRIEGGQHVTSVRTLERLAKALEMKVVIRFESDPTVRPTRKVSAG